MKSGFYLRPDGKEIIELVDYSSFVHGEFFYRFIVTSRIASVADYEENLVVYFGNWIYLGR